MWQAGSIWGSNWFFVGALLPWLVIGFFFAMKRHRLLDIFQLGDETAISVGIAVKKERIVSLLLAVMLAASAISVTGGIKFFRFTCATYCSQMWFYATKTGIAIGGVVWEFTFIG